MGRRPTGTVEPLRTTIRLKFTWKGARCVETLELAPTPANIKAAERLMARVQAAILAGSYDPREFFPKPGQGDPTTFAEYAEGWLDTLTGAKSTRRSYASALNGTWVPEIGEKKLSEIKHSDIRRAIGKRAKVVSGKTINNGLIALRGVLKTAVRDGLIAKSPADGIENQPHQAAEPDPFEPNEVAAILAHMTDRYPAEVADYYTFAFQTGLRPSEQIAAAWPKLDVRRRKLRIDTARVDWEDKATKTNKVRDIDLSDDAMAVLQRQKTRTFLAGGAIFANPNTGKAWADEQVQRRRYWNPALKALGLRQRDAYQTRHTYATTALMGGINPAYIAKQLGHAKITTTLNVYARWIEGADKGAEAAKLNAILSRKSPRETALR